MRNYSNQEIVNANVKSHYYDALKERNRELPDWADFRRCSAEVCETSNYYHLRSYRTIVAVIDKRTNTCYDALRMVYGYTATSAQHISKFKRDYGIGKYGCEKTMTWRSL